MSSVFKKAKGEQAALKMGLYGLAGSGKTFTSLLIAEGLAKLSGKRIAFIDTEHGTDFYCQKVPARKIHPEAFDFDAIYTRSITEVINAVKGLDVKEHCIIIIDSISHIWEAAIAAYEGNTTKIGTIPLQAWGKIKKPYKELMSLMLTSPLHLIICGRQVNEFERNDATGNIEKTGVKMKAEGETPYEPHILIQMRSQKKAEHEVADIVAFAEKDRTGVLAGREIYNPTFKTLGEPLVSLLSGSTQANMESLDQTAQRDAEAIAETEKEEERIDNEQYNRCMALITLCTSAEEFEKVKKQISDAKKSMSTAHVSEIKELYLKKEDELKKKGNK